MNSGRTKKQPHWRDELSIYTLKVRVIAHNYDPIFDSGKSAKAFIENYPVQIIPPKSTRPSREQDGQVRAIGVSIIIDVTAT